MKFLVICHGNINRSPACAAVLQRMGHDVNSAGFVNPGKLAAGKMRRAMKARGYDLEYHRSKLITQKQVDWADKVVLMDSGNARRFAAAFPDDVGKVTRLGDHANPPVVRIPDPNYMAEASEKFLPVVTLIMDASLRLGREGAV